MRTTAVVFGLTAGVIAASAALTYTSGQRVLELYRVEEKRHRAVVAAATLFSTVQDAETGQRGYIITGDAKYLAPFESAERRIDPEMQRLRNSVEGEISPEQDAALEAAVRAEMDQLRHTIELRRTGGLEAVMPAIVAGTGKAAMDHIREIFFEIRAAQEQALEGDRKRSARATQIRTGTFATTGALTVLVLLWGFLRIQRAIAERNAAIAEEQNERELLSTTLSSIGDCVIVTDVKGRITFMNAVAVNVTGWPEAEAVGRPLKEVFRIVNEETRQPVEDPVEKVIRSGVIVGLANHTVLIRRDNTEVPIDDSGAPVRSPHGDLQGVVLVFRDFSETKRAQLELLAAKEAAENASRAKDTFLAMLSHELRTPLTPVLATLQAWDLSKDVPASFRPQVYMLRRNLELEARLIDDLLDLTRISRGVLAFHPEVVDVHSIIDLLVGIVRSDVLRKQINFQIKLEARHSFVNTDPSRLQQVLWNILRNAVNYTDEQGQVLVETADDAEWLSITVSDTGLGMTAETIQRLFRPFEQADRTRSLHYGGLGVGLAISHALIEQMGGEIVATSAGLGHGSKFTVRLKTVGEPSAATAPPLPLTARPPRTHSILLVEDHVDTALALAHLLRMRGHQVRTAASTREGEAEFARHHFDLFICDIGLPDGTGYDLVKRVRERSGIAAIAVTGFGMQSDIDRALSAGFDAHVTKPIDLSRLESAIAESERRAQTREVALG